MSEFLTVDESIKVSQREEYAGREWEHSYYDFTGDYRIKKTDKSDIPKNLIALYIYMGPAVPVDLKEKKEVLLETIEETLISPKEQLSKEYDHISSDAHTYGAEDYRKEDFLPFGICRELWKLDIRRKTITGWAYYMMSLMEKTKRTTKDIVVLRPLVDPTVSNKIYRYTFASHAYLKTDYSEMTHVSEYKLRSMEPFEIKQLILKTIENSNSYNSDKITVLKGGVPKVVIMSYKTPMHKDVFNWLSSISDNPPVEIQVEKYLEDTGQRLELTREAFDRLVFEYNTLYTEQYGNSQM